MAEHPSYWYAALAIALGIGGYVLSQLVHRIHEATKTPKSMSEHLPNLERAYLRVVAKNRELLEAVREANEERRHLPPEYQAILDQVLMLARLVEQSSYEEAVASGVVPRYWFGGPTEEQPVMTPQVQPAEHTAVHEPGAAEAQPAPQEPPGEWMRVGGQLVPRRRQQNGAN